MFYWAAKGACKLRSPAAKGPWALAACPDVTQTPTEIHHTRVTGLKFRLRPLAVRRACGAVTVRMPRVAGHCGQGHRAAEHWAGTGHRARHAAAFKVAATIMIVGGRHITIMAT